MNRPTLAASIPDTVAVIALAVLMGMGTLAPSTGIAAILAVLAGRLWPQAQPPSAGTKPPPSDPMPPASGVLTIALALGALGHYAAAHALSPAVLAFLGRHAPKPS